MEWTCPLDKVLVLLIKYDMEKVDFTKLSNSEINIKLMGYENEYEIKKSKIIELVHDLEDLDKLYISAKNELKKRGVLNDA